MKLRSGDYKPAGIVQNQIRLRGGRKISVPMKEGRVEMSREKVRQSVRKSQMKKLWPFNADTIKILRGSDVAVPSPNDGHDAFVKFYQQRQDPVAFCVQFIPTYNGQHLVCSGHLRICHTKQNLRDLTTLFMTAWRKFDSLLLTEIKKIKLKTKTKQYKVRQGYLLGLCYNMLLTAMCSQQGSAADCDQASLGPNYPPV